MKSVILTAGEASALKRSGVLRISSSRGAGLSVGDAVYIKEPWVLLKAPPGAYFLDLPARYRLPADATAEPYFFQYNPAETMPREAVKRFGRVTSITSEEITLTLL